MCETLDEIHEAQLAAVIARMRQQKAKSAEAPFLYVTNFFLKFKSLFA